MTQSANTVYPETPDKSMALATPGPMVAFTVWGLGALFYLMGFYHRVAPAVITEDLMRSFSINAAALGNMSAFYFYSYVAMQIPTGILADRWGPRKLLTTGALIAGIGTLVFAVAGNVMWANLGRLLIGGSVAVAFVSILKLGGDWFPAEKFALIPGWAVFFGIIGAVSAGVPLRLLVDAFDWRMVIGGSAVITLAIGVAIWIVIRDTPAERGYANFESPTSEFKEDQSEGIVSGLAKTLKYRNVWLLYFIPGGVVGCVLTFSGLWGVPFLTTHYQMTTETASFLTSAMMIAWAVAGPFFGALSNRMGKRKIIYLGALMGLIFCWSIILLGPILPLPLLVVLLLLAGVFSGCMTLSFPIVKESVPPSLTGTATGFINMGVMSGPMVLQPAVGLMMDRYWQGEMLSGVRVYGLEAYHAGFLLMIAWLVLSTVLIFFVKETGHLVKKD